MAATIRRNSGHGDSHLLPLISLLVDMGGDDVRVNDTEDHQALEQMFRDLINGESKMTQEEKDELHQKIMTNEVVQEYLRGKGSYPEETQ